MSWKDRATKVSAWKQRATQKDPEKGVVATTEDPAMDPSAIVETATDMAKAAHQGATLGWSDEIAGTVSALGEKDVDSMRRSYTETRDKVRESVNKARQRSPIATTVAEIATPSPLDLLAPKLGKVASIASAPAQGAIAGAGYAREGEETESALAGGALGALGSLAVKAIKAPFTRPREVRARSLGAGAREFQERGIKSRERVDEFLDDLGFYKDPKSFKVFDVKTGTFKPSKQKPPKNMRPTEIQLRNADRAIEKTNNVVDDVIAEAAESYPLVSYDDLLKSPAMRESMMKLRAESMANPDMKKSVDKIVDHVGTVFGEEGMDLYNINNLKRSLQQNAKKSFTTVGDATPDSSVFAELSSGINKFIADSLNKYSPEVGDAVRGLNRVQSNLLTQSEDLVKRIAQEKGSPLKSMIPIGTGPTYAAYRGAETASASPIAGMTRARIGLAAEGIPGAGMAERVVKQAPFRTLLPGQDAEMQGPLDKWTSIPEMIIKTPIPRSSEAILANKEFVLEKIRMMMPMMYDNVSDIIEKQPQKIPEILPMIVQTAPHLFETDEYNRIDGKLLTPEDRAKAIEDTIKRDDLSNSDRVSILDKINVKGMM